MITTEDLIQTICDALHARGVHAERSVAANIANVILLNQQLDELEEDTPRLKSIKDRWLHTSPGPWGLLQDNLTKLYSITSSKTSRPVATGLCKADARALIDARTDIVFLLKLLGQKKP